MKLKKRKFMERDEEERDELLANIWCNTCGEINMGVENTVEYEGNGFIFIEGRCKECGEDVVSTIETSAVS